MPKTHSERMTDTATLILNSIPIPTPSLTDHLKATPEGLISLLTHKDISIGPMIESSTKENFL